MTNVGKWNTEVLTLLCGPVFLAGSILLTAFTDCDRDRTTSGLWKNHKNTTDHPSSLSAPINHVCAVQHTHIPLSLSFLSRYN